MIEIVMYSKKYREDLSKLIVEFYRQSLDEYGLVEDDKTIEEFEASCGQSTFILLKEGEPIGLLAGSVAYSNLFRAKVYQELVWYVDEKHRGEGLRLLKHLEEWCKEKGIKKIIMAFMHNSMPERLYEFYIKKGYIPLETHLIKDVS